jgi:hypothetical protein
MIKIELEGIRQTMLHAFIEYQDGISKQVRTQLDRILSEEGFADMLAFETKRQFEEAVRSAIKSYFEYGDGHHAIRDAINGALGAKTRAKRG